MAMQFSKEDQEKMKNDKSEIYQKRTERTNQEDIMNLSRKGKIQHFKDYYLKTVLIVVVIVAIVGGSIIKSVTDRKATALYVAIQKDAFAEETIAAYEDAIEKYLKINRENEMVIVNTSLSDQELQTLFYAGTADILITSESAFEAWGAGQYFYDSENCEEVSFYKDYDEKYLYRTQYITSEDILNNKETDVAETKPSDNTAYNCGIYLTDSEKYMQIGGGIAKPVLGISNNTKHLAEAKKFTKYMMDNTQKMELDIKKSAE